jgi:hypothetical protein
MTLKWLALVSREVLSLRRNKFSPETVWLHQICRNTHKDFSVRIYFVYHTKHSKSLNCAACPFFVATANLQSYWQSVYHYADLSPPPDDSLVTLATSLTRISTKSFVLKGGNGCLIHPGNVLEVTSYHNNDNYKVCMVILLLIIAIQHSLWW